MFNLAAFGPSLAAVGHGLRPWRPPGRLRAHAAIATAAFVCYILHRLLDGGASTAFAVVGLGACGWSWLLTRALFDPARHDAGWPRVVAGLVAAAAAASVLVPAGGALARIADSAYTLSGSAALMLTFVEPFHRGRPGLATVEQRFRLAFLAIYALLIAVSILGLRAAALQDDLVKAACAAVGLAAALSAVWFRLRHPLASADAATTPPQPPRPPTPEDTRLAERLLRLLGEDQIHAQPDLKIADVAARLGQPEHKVSSCIRAALGFANFNRLINHHRIARAKHLLADPADTRSILEIAFDCGFASLGPFNRAFKDEAGVTPRAFRAESRRGGGPGGGPERP